MSTNQAGLIGAIPAVFTAICPTIILMLARLAGIQVHVEIHQIFPREVPRVAVPESQLLEHLHDYRPLGERVQSPP